MEVSENRRLSQKNEKIDNDMVIENTMRECEFVNDIESGSIHIDELLKMSEEEFDMFLDLIDCKSNETLTKFAIWVHKKRMYNNK